MTPQVTKITLFAAQVCVPKEWNDEQARAFLEREAPCGTERGWKMRKQGSADLNGADERVHCQERSGFVHIMFDA